jgi:hypothetical protein
MVKTFIDPSAFRFGLQEKELTPKPSLKGREILKRDYQNVTVE